MDFRNTFLNILARPSVIDLAHQLNEFDRWAVANGFHPEDPDAADFYGQLREGH